MRGRGRGPGLAQAFSSIRPCRHGLQRYYDARNLYLLLRKHRASHPGGRRAFASWLEYLKYVYYRISIEREQGQEKAADAVLSGLCDALAGRFGPQGPPPRALLPCFDRCSGLAMPCVAAGRGDKISPMRFLFVKPRLAWPRSSGHDVHSYQMMRALARCGHSSGLATVVPACP